MKRRPGSRRAWLRKRERTDAANPSAVGAKFIRHNLVRGVGAKGSRWKFTDRFTSPKDKPNTLQGTRH